ncbi:WXG100 family type VII secretion target [Prescottella defluvii]|uniref:WXG100-like domain-containing protein n=1 Tax=Prescottella defluvii TaxID=1323361 RepID=UPI0004F37951
MPIPLFVPGDPTACRECADRLQALANGVTEYAGAFDDARGKSESEWVGTAGDEFRDRVAEMKRGTSRTVESAAAAAAAIRAFADDLETAAKRMLQAAEIAAAAGLRVLSGPGGAPGTVEDPDPIAFDAGDIDAEVRYARQRAAFDEAAEMAQSGRAAESNAHNILNGVLEQTSAAVRDMRGQWYWMAAAVVTGYIGTAASEVGKASQVGSWKAMADARAQQLATFRSIAAEAVRSGDPYWETTAAKAVTTFQPAADDAARVVAQNTKLLAGMVDNPVVKGMSAPLVEGGTSTISKVGSKVPIVGVAVVAAQTTFDVAKADDMGDAALAAGKDVGGFMAGTAATSLILASAAGGPATLVAVGTGVLVSWGVGYAMEKMWGD